MTRHFGASHNLEELIGTHLFVICPNNSGSTYLKNLLSTCRKTWNLAREGQHTPGFVGPSSRGLGAGKMWATPRWLGRFTDAAAFDWQTSRKAWYFQAFSHDPNAPVFVEKSPPFLLLVDQLDRHFRNSKFIFMVRNPYAAVEGSCRRWRKKEFQHTIPREEDLFKEAALHLMTCFEFQRRNREAYSRKGVFFTYEQMCDDSEQVESLLKSLVPELQDLIVKQRIPVKDYHEMLRNMNAQQIANLTSEKLGWINQIFSKYPGLLEYFGYSRLERVEDGCSSAPKNRNSP